MSFTKDNNLNTKAQHKAKYFEEFYRILRLK